MISIKLISIFGLILCNSLKLDAFLISQITCVYTYDIETVTVDVYYNHHSGKKGATSELIKTVCGASEKFGISLDVYFHLIARVQDTGKGPECKPGEDCAEELTEMCTYLQAKDSNKYICCRYSGKEPNSCLSENGITQESITKCVQAGFNSDAGKQLLDSRNMMDKAKLGEGKLPAMVFNDDEYNECVDNYAFKNFIPMVCAMLNTYKVVPPC